MIVVVEQDSASLVDPDLAFEVVRSALIDCAAGAKVFPAVIAHGSRPENRVSIKSGAGPRIAGAKIGTYWPGNLGRGLPRHCSAIILLDQETGRIGALVEAATVNAYRTAAADAVAASRLARADSSVLAIFGAGHQAAYECLALARVLPITTVHIVARDPAKAQGLAGRLAAHGLEARASAAEEACRAADVIVTATSAREPLFRSDWVRPGTHVASMGSDAVGKQELPVELVRRAACFCDLPSQSVAIGEFQHVASEVAAGRVRLTAIGDVLAGRARGRVSDDAITVFDSSGVALQDLYIGEAIVRRFLDARGISTN